MANHRRYETADYRNIGSKTCILNVPVGGMGSLPQTIHPIKAFPFESPLLQ